MDVKHSIPPKNLDGGMLPAGQIGKSRGHNCSWDCLKTRTNECGEHEDQIWAEMREKTIERAKYDFMKLSPSIKEEAHDFYQACDILLSIRPDGETKRTKKARYQLGAREFTLTYSPKWMDDETARQQMTVAINKLLKYYSEEIVHLRAVGEVGSNGLSHVHCFYKLKEGVKITDKNFIRAWKHWNPKKKIGRGFEGGHHANVREESDFLGYIDKDIDDAWLDINACPLRE